jgi:hypothetical protein
MTSIAAPGSFRQRRGFALSLLIGGLSVSVAGAQSPPAATPPPPAAAPAESVDPAVNTSSAATPAARPAARPATTQGSPTTGGRRAMDRVDLDASQITGNRELPRVLYIVPWKRSDLGDLTGKPVNSLLDEVLAPVDRDVFRRETRYFDALATGPAPASGGNAAAPAADAPARTMPTVPAAPSGTGDSVRDGSQPVTPPGT